MKKMIQILLAMSCLIIPIEFLAQLNDPHLSQFQFETEGGLNVESNQLDYYTIPKMSKRSNDLDNTFFNYQLFDFAQTKEIRSSIEKKSAKGQIHSMNFDLGTDAPVNFTFTGSKLFSDEFVAHVLTDNGTEDFEFETNITFKGIVNGDPGQRLRLTITEDIFYAWFQLNGEEYFIEPLWYMERHQAQKSAKNIHVAYSKRDIKPTPHLTCGNEDVMDMKKRMPEPSQEKMMGCAIADLALAGAFDMIAAYANVTGVMTKLAAVTNNMAALYVPMEIEYEIVDMVVPASAASDPWFTGTCMDDLLPSFAAWGPTGFATHDLGQLWVNRNVTRDSGNGLCDVTGLIGRASGLGTVCTPAQYNCCEDWQPSNAAAQAHLSAHEIGHNWDGEHGDAANDDDIMWPSLNSSSPNTVFSVVNTTDMQSHRDSRTCLASCVCLSLIHI